MKISASVQAANQLNLLEDIENNKKSFDQLHIDITDGHFAENISMSFNIIKQLKHVTDYYIDVHLMIENNVKYTEVAFNNGADFVTVHSESIDVESFKISDRNTICASNYQEIKIINLQDNDEWHLNLGDSNNGIYSLDCDEDWLWFTNSEGLLFFKCIS